MAWGMQSLQIRACRAAVCKSRIRARVQQIRMTLVCEKCGAQYPRAPSFCVICCDERGALGRDGQSWLTVDELHEGHKNVLLEEEPDILSIGVEPPFAVGQRALVIRTGEIQAILLMLLTTACTTVPNNAAG